MSNIMNIHTRFQAIHSFVMLSCNGRILTKAKQLNQKQCIDSIELAQLFQANYVTHKWLVCIDMIVSGDTALITVEPVKTVWLLALKQFCIVTCQRIT